jgi:hypothetical protein
MRKDETFAAALLSVLFSLLIFLTWYTTGLIFNSLGLYVGNALLNVVFLVREGDDDVTTQLGHLTNLQSFDNWHRLKYYSLL